MKNLKFNLSLMLFMTLSFTMFALQETNTIELGDPRSLVEWLSPVIVWVATAVAKPILKLPGWAVVTIVVPLLAFVITYFTTGLEGDLAWIQQLIYSLGAVFIQEVKKRLQPAVTT